MENSQQNEQICTFDDILPKLNHNQLRFVVAMQECSSKKEAAEMIGLEPHTVYKWPDYVDDAVRLFATAVADNALDILANSAVRAAIVKVAGLYDDDDNIRQRAATEILDRTLGKPNQPQEITTSGEQTIRVIYDRSEPVPSSPDPRRDSNQ